MAAFILHYSNDTGYLLLCTCNASQIVRNSMINCWGEGAGDQIQFLLLHFPQRIRNHWPQSDWGCLLHGAFQSGETLSALLRFLV